MSDYKEIVESVISKAKELSSSASISDAVEKVKDAAQSTGILDVYEKGAQRARSFGAATKLTVDLNRDHKELERVFAEIGKLYYQQTQGTESGFFVPLFEQVRSLRETIASREADIESYKASFSSLNTAESEEGLDGSISDFESIVNQTESDGASK